MSHEEIDIREILSDTRTLLELINPETGWCMCGQNVGEHVYGSMNHEFVDEGVYRMEKLITDIDKILKGLNNG